MWLNKGNKKVFVIILLCSVINSAYSQDSNTPGPPRGYVAIPPMGYRLIEIWTHPDDIYFYEQSIEEKLESYFTEFKYRFRTPSPTGSYSDGIVMEHGPEIIPYLKGYLLNTNFFAGDNTLLLIAYLFNSLHTYSYPHFHDMVMPYNLDENDIQWFIDQYKNKIDEYILSTMRIDRIVRDSEWCIQYIAGFNASTNTFNTEKYGHHAFFGNNNAEAIKIYYENRLKISNLIIENFY